MTQLASHPSPEIAPVRSFCERHAGEIHEGRTDNRCDCKFQDNVHYRLLRLAHFSPEMAPFASLVARPRLAVGPVVSSDEAPQKSAQGEVTHPRELAPFNQEEKTMSTDQHKPPPQPTPTPTPTPEPTPTPTPTPGE